MSDELEPEVRELLQAARETPRVPGPVRARILQRLNASIAAPTPATPSGVSRVAGWKLIKPLSLAVAFGAGGGVGATLHAVLHHGAVRTIVIREAPPEVPRSPDPELALASSAVTVSPAAPTATSAPPVASVRTPTKAPVFRPNVEPASLPAVPTSHPAGGDGRLARERSLLEMAHTAIRRGDVTSAADALRHHEEEFPDGQFVEEREALAVELLVAQNLGDEARARADRFRTRFPRSLFLPVVDDALQKLP